MHRVLAASLAALLAASAPALAWTNTNTGSGQIIDGGGTGNQAFGGAGGAGGAGGSARQSQKAISGSQASATTGGVTVNSGSGQSGGGGGVFLSIPDGHGEAPCGGGIGLGGGGSSASGGIGGTWWEFEDCKRMRESAALDRMGFRDAAVSELCQIDRIRRAFGGTCPSEAAHPVPVSTRKAYPWDWCATRNAGDKNQHLECNRQ